MLLPIFPSKSAYMRIIIFRNVFHCRLAWIDLRPYIDVAAYTISGQASVQVFRFVQLYLGFAFYFLILFIPEYFIISNVLANIPHVSDTWSQELMRDG